jgi:CRISPR/Cas system-associated protein Cas5 (RAMP superfamily)
MKAIKEGHVFNSEQKEFHKQKIRDLKKAKDIEKKHKYIKVPILKGYLLVEKSKYLKNKKKYDEICKV